MSFARTKLAIRAAVIVALTLAVCASDRSIGRAESAPEWLTTAGRADLNHFGDGSAAVVLLNSTDFSVDSTGKFVETERVALRVLNRRAADRYLHAMGFENSDRKVTSIQSWTISPAGKITTSGKKDVVSVAAFPDWIVYSDDRIKGIEIPGAEDGSLVGYEVVTQGHLAINGDSFRMEEEIPTRAADLHVTVPSGSLRWFVNHPDRIQIVKQGPSEATFHTENRPAVPDESDAPPFSSLAAEVLINYDPKGPAALQTWEEAGHEYHALFDNGESPEKEIATEVETLSSSASDELAKVDALYTFVSREIRYVAIEIGVGGYKPHLPADVFKNRYGDCKDKATLLISMLNKIGIRAYPALVGTRGDVEANPAEPTLATFDHMIVALPVSDRLRAAAEKLSSYDPQNQILWIDPTSEFDPLGEVPETDQGVFALVAYPDNGSLQRIPEPAAAQNGVDYAVNLHVGPDGIGSAEVEAKYVGSANSHRHAFYRDRSQAEILKGFEERVTRYASQVTFRKASIAGTEDNRRQIGEQFSFSGNFAVASAGNSWFLQPLILSGIAVPEVGSRPRELPLDVGTPHHVKIDYRLELPAGSKVEGLPNKMSAKSEFGEIDIEYAMNGSVLTASQSMSFTQSRIPPEKYPAFRDFMNTYIRATRQRVRVLNAGS